MTAAFGAEAAGWGEAEAAGEGTGEDVPGSIDLGNGHRMTINAEVWRKLLHSAPAVEGIVNRANSMCADANSIGKVGRGKHGPLYEVSLQNRSNTTRARARVRPIDYWGMLDDAQNNTLLTVMANYPSDPIPGADSSPDEPEPPDSEPDAGDEAGDAEAAGTEAAEVGVEVGVEVAIL
jgi:hypothetical protein